MQNRSDEQLITDYFNGDEESLEILIKRYLKPVYGFVYRYVGNPHDAEDVAQTVFIKVWRNLGKFKRRGNFKAWIFRIARNASLDWLKKKKPIAFSAFETEEGENFLAETLVDSSPLPDELAEKKNISETLSKVIEKLSFNYRLILILHYRHSFTFREIAGILKESIDTIKTRHRRAIAVLRKLIQNNEPKYLS